jgi:hypothetical protein
VSQNINNLLTDGVSVRNDMITSNYQKCTHPAA